MNRYIAKKTSIQEQFLIIDGTAQLFRGFFGNPLQQTKNGEHVNAVLGMVSNIRELINSLKPKYFSVVFDAGQYTFRNEIYPEYKANRGDPPDELKGQFELAQQFIQASGFPSFMKKNFEADDVIATLVKKATAHNLETLIVSADKDLFQLIRDDAPAVQIYDALGQTILNSENVVKKIGVEPRLAVDYFALVGDSIDNVPGVKGIGSKTAQQLLQHFSSFADIFARKEEILQLNIRGKDKVLESIKQSEPQRDLLYQLIKLRDDVDLNIKTDTFLQQISWSHFDEKQLGDFLTRLESGRRLKAFTELWQFYQKK